MGADVPAAQGVPAAILQNRISKRKRTGIAGAVTVFLFARHVPPGGGLELKPGINSRFLLTL